MRDKIKIKILKNMLEEVTKKYDYFISLQNEKMKETFNLAIRDRLTGLYNRQFLDEHAKQAFGRLQRHDGNIILIFIDLDNFKYVNDSFGHAKGDEVLKKVADIFTHTFRSYDIIVRYGGDEFVVLIEDDKYDKDDIENILKNFVKKIEHTLGEFRISASYGYGVAPLEAKNMEKLIELADERMYIQKQNRKR